MAAIRIASICNIDRLSDTHICMIFQCAWFTVYPIASRSMTSPIRFVMAVIRPAASDLGFW